MIIEITVPQLPESVSEATLLQWKKKAGEAVARDENLIDIETDKVVLEISAPQAGVLVSILQEEGATVGSLQLIATIDTEAVAVAPVAAATPVVATEQQIRVEAAAKEAGVSASAIGFGTAVMPAAKKMAADAGVNPADVAGTGRGGRVLKEDVQNHLAKPVQRKD